MFDKMFDKILIAVFLFLFAIVMMISVNEWQDEDLIVIEYHMTEGGTYAE